MPTNPGLRWVLKSGKYKKSVMTDGVSLGQIQWLNYVETTELCLDLNGKRIKIESAYYRGEHKEDFALVDGYFVKQGCKYFLEYLG